MVRVVIEIPHGFAEYCKAMGDAPGDVIWDLIDEFMDDPLGRGNNSASPGSTATPSRGGRETRETREASQGLAGRPTTPDIAEFLRERG
jgi:hypothetical protein